MNTYLQIGYVISIAGLAAAASLFWTLFALDLVNIGWGQPLMLTIILAVMVWAYAMIQLSSPAHAEILKDKLERESQRLATATRFYLELCEEAGELYSEGAECYAAGEKDLAQVYLQACESKLKQADSLNIPDYQPLA